MKIEDVAEIVEESEASETPEIITTVKIELANTESPVLLDNACMCKFTSRNRDVFLKVGISNMIFSITTDFVSATHVTLFAPNVYSGYR